MDGQLANFIIEVDKLLLAMALLIAITVVVYAALREASDKRRALNLLKIKNNLRRLASVSGEKMEESIPLFIREYSPQQLSLVAKEKDFRLPENLVRQIKNYFINSEKIFVVENTAASSRDKWSRIEAIITLGYVNSPRTLEILKSSILDRDADISYFSMQALGRLKNNEAVGILLEFLRDHPRSGYNMARLLETFPASISTELYKAVASPYSVVRYWALKLIGKFKAGEDIEMITGLTADVKSDVRAAACECLGELKIRETTEAIKVCLKDRFWFVRMHAVRALDKILGAEGLADVIGLINDPAAKVKEGVKNIMAKDIEKALPHIEENLFNGDEATRRYCVDALVDAAYIPIILENILSETPEVEQRAMRLMAGLVKSKVYFGLKRALGSLPMQTQEKIINIVEAIDGGVAGNLR